MELKSIALLLGKYLGFSFLIFMMGAMGFSFSWILFGAAIWAIGENVRHDKENLFAIRKQTVIDEKKEILTRIKDLPAWVFFPDVERCEWLNKMIRLLWPCVGDYVKDYIREHVEPKIRQKVTEKCNINSFTFEKIELGDMPIKIGGIKVYSETYSRHEIIMDLDLFYTGDCFFQVSLGGPLKAGIKDIQFHGNMRVIMKPLTKKMPLIGAVQVFLLNPPEIDFNLTNSANFFDFPALGDGLRKVVTDVVSSILVLPNKIAVKLIPDIPTKMFNLPEPKGVIRISAIEARDLMKKDIGILGKSDPYAIITVRGEEFRTPTINSTVNPRWNYVCEAVIFDLGGLNLHLEVKDDDKSNEDDSLGRTNFSIEQIFEKGTNDFWLTLDDASSGQIHLEAKWFALNKDILQLQNYHITENKTPGCSTCILVVYVDSAKQLPSGSKTGVEPSPMVRFSVAGNKGETTVCNNTNNPVWEQGFTFRISDPEMTEFSLKVFDKKTDIVLGQLVYPLKKLMSENNLEINAAFPLRESGSNAHIQLYFQLLVMVPGTGVSVENQLSSASTVDSGLEIRDVPANLQTADALQPTEEIVPTPKQYLEEEAVLRRRQTKTPDVYEGNERPSINITMRHSKQKQALIVVVHKVVNLPCPNATDPPDPYVKLQLVPEIKDNRRKTSTIKNNCNPIYDETFEFPIGTSDLLKHSLLIYICFKSSSSFFTKKKRIGKVNIVLAEHELNSAITNWFDLETSECDDEQ